MKCRSRPDYRRRGLRFERWICEQATHRRLLARRLPEGGLADEGDLEVCLPDGYRIVIEAKHATRISPADVLAHAKAKTRSPVALIWKRPHTSPRTSPPLVAMTFDDWLDLITQKGHH